MLPLEVLAQPFDDAKHPVAMEIAFGQGATVGFGVVNVSDGPG